MNVSSIVERIKQARNNIIEAMDADEETTLTELSEKIIEDNKVVVESPIDYYKRTRPSDWIEIEDVRENEIVILIEMPTKLKFNIDVDFRLDGTIYNSGDNSFTYDGDGYKEVRIEGLSPISSFSFINISNSEKRSSYNIKEIIFNTPQLQTLYFGGEVLNEAVDCIQCKYITFKGENITNINCMFSRNEKLETVVGFNFSKVTTGARMFRFCTNLHTLGVVDLSNCTDVGRGFDSSGLENLEVHLGNPGNPGNKSVLFGWCSRMREVKLVVETDLNLDDMFTSTDDITKIIIETEQAVSMNGLIRDKRNLKILKINRKG